MYTLKLFNTGQVTLPKKWRDKVDTSLFLAEETAEGLLIKPIKSKGPEDVVFYESKEGFGIYSEKGMDPHALIARIKQLDGQD